MITVDELKQKLDEITASLVSMHPDLHVTVVERTCPGCLEPYPAWATAAPSEMCPSCTLLTPTPPATEDGLLRHDTPLEVGTAIAAYNLLRNVAQLQGDPVPPVWESAAGFVTAPVVALARAVIQGRARTGEDAHRVWLAQFQADGWRFGRVLDPIKKLHPNIREWVALTHGERRRHNVAVAVIQALIE